MADENTFVNIMRFAMRKAGGNQDKAFAEFTAMLLDHDDPQLVWDCFESVRTTVLKRLYTQAGWLEHREDQRSDSLTAGIQPIAESDESKIVVRRHERQLRRRGSTDLAAQTHSPGTYRDQQSVMGMITRIGSQKTQMDLIHDHLGQPLSSLTYAGLLRFAEVSPVAREFAILCAESGMPKTDFHIVGDFLTNPDEINRYWKMAQDIAKGLTRKTG